MFRALATLVVIEVLLIAVIVVLRFGAEEGPKQLSRSAEELVEMKGERDTEPRRSAETGARDSSREHELDDEASTVTLFGSVRGADGRYHEETVVLSAADGSVLRIPTVGGLFVERGVPSGHWRLGVAAKGFRNYATELDLGDSSVRELEIVLEEPRVLPIIVRTLEGEPARVKLAAFLPWSDIHAVATNVRPSANFGLDFHGRPSDLGRGRFRRCDPRAEPSADPRRPGETIGHLEIDDDLSVHVSLILYGSVIATQEVSARAEEVVFRLSDTNLRDRRASFRVLLVDAETGAPIPDARLRIGPPNSFMRTVRGDSTGAVLIENLYPGLNLLTIEMPGSAKYSELVRIDPARSHDRGRLELGRPARLKGFVHPAAGEPGPVDVYIHHLDAMRFPQTFGYGDHRAVGAGGVFEFGDLAPGRHVVRARTNDGDCAYQVVTVVSGQDSALDLVLVEGAPVVILDELAGVDAAFVRVLDAEGVPVHAGFGARQELSLPPGFYRLEVHRDFDLIMSRAFTLSRDGLEISIR